MSIHYPGKQNRVVTAIVWDLYQNGQITFDDDMTVNYSGEALRQLEEVLTPRELIMCPFEESISFGLVRIEEIRARSNRPVSIKNALAMH